MSRVAGVTLPLFSLRSRSDWGIGQITDLPPCAEWIRRGGLRLLQILPPYELADGETSPYGARTAFGLDPIYIGIEQVEDLDAAAIAGALGAEGRSELERVRATRRVQYASVRALKTRVLHHAFERFYAREWQRGTRRADALRGFIDRERGWAEDLAVYVALREQHNGWSWEMWPEDERHRDPEALARARAQLQLRILEHQYLQWIAHTQWDRARGEMRGIGVELMGDLPFVVGTESADVWARAAQFRRDLSLGAPPDAFSPDDGQDWGLPPYDMRVMEEDNFGWLRARTQHAARLYDRFRLDHVVGYFRQWVKPRVPEGAPKVKGYFDPEGEDAQQQRGEKVLRVLQEAAGDAHIIGEDLGVIPPFVRQTMARLSIPGYKVIPWEKDESNRFRDPAHFPPVSTASWSTHDTQPITAWWHEFSDHDKADLVQVCRLPQAGADDARALGMMRTLMQSGSQLALALAPELLGEKERINTPGTVSEDNWGYRLPKPIEDLSKDERVVARFDVLREMIAASGR
jgi:4-alpha-glucanotransferase